MLLRLFAGFSLLVATVVGRPIPAPSDDAPRTFGLFVGIGDYRDQPTLHYCAEDAIKVAKLFGRLRSPLRLPPERATVLTDSAATRQAVLDALDRIGDRIRPRDILVFYFTGHGGGEDEPDLPPLDERDGHDETLVTWDADGSHEADISDDQLEKILWEMPRCRKIILIDACFSGGFIPDLKMERCLVMTAAREDQSPSIAEAYRSSGSFSHAFIAGLEGEADRNHDGKIETRELVDHLRLTIPRYCTECGRRNPPERITCEFDKTPLGRRHLEPQFMGAIDLERWNRF